MPVVDATLIRERLVHPGYELFIVGISILSLVNLVLMILAPDPDVDQVIRIIDGCLCIIFLIDFGWRLATAPDRRAYMRLGWADFLGSLPAPGLRLFRLIHVGKAVSLIRAAGGRRIVRQLLRERAETAIFSVFFVSIVVLELASVFVLIAERPDPNANITTGGDALWWAWVTVTSVGYGDKYPVTPWGRIVGTVLIGVGIGLITTITGFLATKLLPQRDGAPRAEEAVLQTEEGLTVSPASSPASRPASMAEADPDAEATRT
jgi:voltage-gated potassium channel Kch